MRLVAKRITEQMNHKGNSDLSLKCQMLWDVERFTRETHRVAVKELAGFCRDPRHIE